MSFVSTLLQLDQGGFHLVNGVWIYPWADRLMPFISNPHHFEPFLALGAILLLAFGGFKGRLFIVLMALALIVGDAGINRSIKHLVHRPRPYQAMEGVRMVKEDVIKFSGPPIEVLDGESFTSGHACNNVALAFMACAVYGRSLSFLWLWACLIGYSRVYTGDHYPSDILGGTLVSILYCWAIIQVLEWFWISYGARWFPQQFAQHPQLIPPEEFNPI